MAYHLGPLGKDDNSYVQKCCYRINKIVEIIEQNIGH